MTTIVVDALSPSCILPLPVWGLIAAYLTRSQEVVSASLVCKQFYTLWSAQRLEVSHRCARRLLVSTHCGRHIIHSGRYALENDVTLYAPIVGVKEALIFVDAPEVTLDLQGHDLRLKENTQLRFMIRTGPRCQHLVLSVGYLEGYFESFVLLDEPKIQITCGQVTMVRTEPLLSGQKTYFLHRLHIGQIAGRC